MTFKLSSSAFQWFAGVRSFWLLNRTSLSIYLLFFYMRECKSESSFRWTIIPSLRLFYASQKKFCLLFSFYHVWREKLRLFSLCLLHICFFFFGMFYGLLANHFAQLHLRIGSMGTVYSIFFIVYLLGK